MLDRVIPAHPISKFRKASNEILDDLVKGPVVVTHNGTDAGILLSVSLYNDLITYIRSFQDAEMLNRRLAEMQGGNTSFTSFEDFRDGLKKRDLLDA